MHTGAAAIEFQAVVRTTHRIAFEDAHAQGRETVGTAIGNGLGITLGVAKKHHGFIEQGSLEQLASLDLVSPGGRVPDVA
jgi:hypothetical protein